MRVDLAGNPHIRCRSHSSDLAERWVPLEKLAVDEANRQIAYMEIGGSLHQLTSITGACRRTDAQNTLKLLTLDCPNNDLRPFLN